MLVCQWEFEELEMTHEDKRKPLLKDDIGNLLKDDK